jgi:hypothetical protein
MAQNYADDIHVWEPNKSVGTAVVPNTDLELSNQEWKFKRKKIKITCLIKRMKKINT